MRILIIGGTGFIGCRLVRMLDAAGQAVAVFHRGQTVPDLPVGVAHIRGDQDLPGKRARKACMLGGLAICLVSENG